MPRLFLFLALLAAPILACGFGAPQGVTAPDNPSSASSTSEQNNRPAAMDDNVSSILPPILVAQLPDAALLQIDPESGANVERFPQQVPMLDAVRNNRHLDVDNRLIDDRMRYFAPPPGWVSPDSRWFVYCQGDRLQLRALDGVEVLFAEDAASGLCEPLWSPDGGRFAFPTPQGIVIYDLAQNATRRVAQSQNGAPLSWSPDGQRLLYAVQGQASIANPDGTRDSLAIRVSNLQEAHWLADGKTLLLRDGRGAPVTTLWRQRQLRIGGIHTYDLETRRLRELTGAQRLEGAIRVAPAPGGSAAAFWHLSCRRVLSRLALVLTLECTGELRFLDLESGQTRTLTERTVTGREPLQIPVFTWVQWRPGVTIAGAMPATAAPIAPVEYPPFAPDRSGAPGTTPWRPIPRGETVTRGSHTYQVVEVRRGAEATQLLTAGLGHSALAPLAPEHEHLAARIHIRHVDGARIAPGMAFFPRLMGRTWSGVRHLLLLEGETGQERMTLQGQGELEYWVVFLVHKEDSAPVLRHNELESMSRAFYMALAGDAGLPPEPVIARQAPNAVGLAGPAQPGESVVTENWQVRVEEILTGEEFLRRSWLTTGAPGVFLANPATSNYRLYGVRLRVGYQGEGEHCGGNEFAGVLPLRFIAREARFAYGYPQFELACYLPGGAHEGWLLMVVDTNDPSPNVPVFTLRVPGEESGALRYFAVDRAGVTTAVTGEPEPAAPSAASVDQAPGTGRGSPHPVGSVVEYEGLRYQVLEVRRGDEATAQLTAASTFNAPPPADREYALVRLAVENIGGAAQQLTRREFALTGRAGVLYRPAFVTNLQPALATQLAPDESTEGWLAYEIAAGEAGLILIAPAPSSLNLTASAFLAVTSDAGPATLASRDAVAELAPNQAGAGLDAAAGLDDSIITRRWRVDVREVLRGDEAWDLAAAANPNNTPAPEGYEHVLFRVRLQLIEEQGDRPLPVTGVFLFAVADGENETTPTHLIVPPAPELNAELFTGGAFEGWDAGLAPVGERAYLRFHDPDSRDGPRYIALP